MNSSKQWRRTGATSKLPWQLTNDRAVFKILLLLRQVRCGDVFFGRACSILLSMFSIGWPEWTTKAILTNEDINKI